MKRLISILSVLMLLGISIMGCTATDPMIDDIYTQSIFPSDNVTYDMGSPDLTWDEGYFQDLFVNGAPVGAGGGGDVVGPAGATDHAIARYDTATGKLIQDSGVTIDDFDNIITAGNVDGRDVSVDGAKLDLIEDLADVTDSVNVDDAGATMNTDFNAKGDLLTATADDTPSIQSVGADGTVLTADSGEPDGIKWAAPAGGGGATTVHKAADETVNDSAVLQNDDHLLVAMAANEKWEAMFYILTVGTAASDFKVSFTVPVGATGYYALEGPGQETYAFAAARTVNLAGANEVIHCFHVVVVNGANAGNLQFQWAQDTAVAEDTKVKINSCLVAHEL